jgi:hypothetical protein
MGLAWCSLSVCDVSRRVKLSVLRPAHPERTCWGCDKYCPADDLACGNGTERTQHPIELFGDDWMDWAEANGADDTEERLFGPSEADGDDDLSAAK